MFAKRCFTGASWLLAFALSTACPSPRPDLDYHRARNAMADGRHDQARHYFAADLEYHPNRLESLRGLGMAWSSGTENSQSKAIETFEKGLEVAPEDPELRWRLALALYHRGERPKALEVLRPMVDLSPQIAPETAPEASISFSRIALLLARLYLDDDPTAALWVLEKALTIQPHEASILALTAETFERLGEQERALNFAARALTIDPFRPQTVYLQARIARRQGDEERAQKALAIWDLLRRLPPPTSPPLPPRDAWRIVAEVSEVLGDTSPILKARQARLLLQLRRFDEAITLVEVLLAAANFEDSTWLDLGRVAQEQGRTDLAQRLFAHLLQQQPEHTTALAQQAFLAVETGQFEDAARLVERGLKVDPHHAPSHFTAGLLALARDETDAAVSSLKRAVTLAPWQSRYRLALAELYLSLGQREALADLFEDAPEHPELRAFMKRHLP